MKLDHRDSDHHLSLHLLLRPPPLHLVIQEIGSKLSLVDLLGLRHLLRRPKPPKRREKQGYPPEPLLLLTLYLNLLVRNRPDPKEHRQQLLKQTGESRLPPSVVDNQHLKPRTAKSNMPRHPDYLLQAAVVLGNQSLLPNSKLWLDYYLNQSNKAVPRTTHSSLSRRTMRTSARPLLFVPRHTRGRVQDRDQLLVLSISTLPSPKVLLGQAMSGRSSRITKYPFKVPRRITMMRQIGDLTLGEIRTMTIWGMIPSYTSLALDQNVARTA